MEKQCRNCAFFTPQLYDGNVQPIGRCIHVSFLKAGFGKPNEVAGGKPEVRNDHMQERFPREYVQQQHDEGFFYHDHIDIKMHRGRVCGHWKSPLSLAPEILAYHNDTLDYVKDFPDLHPALKSYFESNLPLVEKHYDKLNRISLWDYDGQDAPDETIKAYESCNSCRHFDPEILADGSPSPFKGKCMKHTVSEQGVFALTSGQETPKVYAFMGCSRHSPSPTYNVKEEPQDLPVRLTIFVETNPMNLTVEQFAEMFKFPTVTRNRAVEQETYDLLMDTDLVQTLRNRHKQVDFNQFFADFALQPVADFFSKGLRNGTVEDKKKHAPYLHYKNAEELLFGAAPEVEAPAEDEASVMYEFGSQLAVPPTAPVND